MFKKINLPRRNVPRLFSSVLCLFFFVLLISQTVFAESDIAKENPYLMGRFWVGGKLLDKVSFPGRPPEYFRMPAAAPIEPNIAMGTNGLTNVPAFDWSYGCSATSAAMMAGYYDNNGYPNMYDGIKGTPAGVCPMNNSEWGSGECSLSATHLNQDDLTDSGHVDDYWIAYGNAGLDPYIGHWAEHTHADCTGDFMKTNQSAYGNSDGSTSFWFYTDGSPTSYADLDAYNYGPKGTYADYDGGCGLQMFFESRFYTVTSMYNQYIYGRAPYNPNQGFTYAQFQAEIDAGRPVLIQVEGHTMLGYGYSTTGSLVYIHDTWDYNDHEMIWGGDYAGLTHYGVTVIHLDASSKGTVLLDASSYSAPDTAYVTVQDSGLDMTAGRDTTTVEFESELGDTAIIELNETGNSTGVFAGSIDLVIGVATENGILEVADGDTITVTYVDTDYDGLGEEILTDTARISLISAPTGLTATAERNYVFLYWNPVDSPVLTGYNVYRSSSPTGAKAKINGTLVTNSYYNNMYLTSGTTYYYWVVAVDDYGIETDYSNSVMVTTTAAGGDTGDGDVDGGNGGGNGSSGPGSLGCFIATACYGTPMAKEVRALSNFRDEYLMTNSLGRMFVKSYYKFSPQLAEYISQRPMLKRFVRIGLKPLVRFSEKLIEE